MLLYKGLFSFSLRFITYRMHSALSTEVFNRRNYTL